MILGYINMEWLPHLPKMITSCAVVVPIYRKPTASESLALAVADLVFKDLSCYICMPESLEFFHPPFETIKLPDRCFSTAKTYGALMVDLDFYRLFQGFDYMLVYQLDCLVFSNRLHEFLALGCDWVAPLILGRSDGFWPSNDIVGVGGFSLRKISSFSSVLALIQRPGFEAEVSVLSDRIERNGAEDMFWSLAAPSIDPSFTVANPDIALSFGFEGDPRKSYLRSNYQKPFGCHHWNRLSFLFWYLPWIPLTLSQCIRFLPPVFMELALAEVIYFWRRIWRRSLGIFFCPRSGNEA